MTNQDYTGIETSLEDIERGMIPTGERLWGRYGPVLFPILSAWIDAAVLETESTEWEDEDLLLLAQEFLFNMKSLPRFRDKAITVEDVKREANKLFSIKKPGDAELDEASRKRLEQLEDTRDTVNTYIEGERNWDVAFDTWVKKIDRNSGVRWAIKTKYKSRILNYAFDNRENFYHISEFLDEEVTPLISEDGQLNLPEVYGTDEALIRDVLSKMSELLPGERTYLETTGKGKFRDKFHRAAIVDGYGGTFEDFMNDYGMEVAQNILEGQQPKDEQITEAERQEMLVRALIDSGRPPGDFTAAELEYLSDAFQQVEQDILLKPDTSLTDIISAAVESIPTRAAMERISAERYAAGPPVGAEYTAGAGIPFDTEVTLPTGAEWSTGTKNMMADDLVEKEVQRREQANEKPMTAEERLAFRNNALASITAPTTTVRVPESISQIAGGLPPGALQGGPGSPAATAAAALAEQEKRYRAEAEATRKEQLSTGVEEPQTVEEIYQDIIQEQILPPGEPADDDDDDDDDEPFYLPEREEFLTKRQRPLPGKAPRRLGGAVR